MTIARIYLATAAFITLAITGIAASAPRPMLVAARATAEQPASLVPEAAVEDGVATAWLRGGPRPATVCKPGTGCCFWVMPAICGQCSVHC
jgi:hypothetical protein